MKHFFNLYERILKADLIIQETRQHLLLELKLGDAVKMCSYPSSVATFTEYTQSCIKFGSKPFVDQRSKRFKPFKDSENDETRAC